MMKVLIATTIFVMGFVHFGVSQEFDIQGHRGCRGLMPENSIPGFLKALDLGVTTLEMDVVISADGKVVVSHDPYISSQFCVNELGIPISKKKEKDINIYRLHYDDVKLFDCGIVGNPDFPEQEKISVYKPLLDEVIARCESHIKQSGRSAVRYNIELKSNRAGDNIYQPEPELFTRLVYEVIKDLIPPEMVIIQSFDPRILQLWRMKYPEYKISCLMSGSKTSDKVIEYLGFKPDIFSPNYKQVNQEVVDEWHKLSVKVIPWTVNDVSEMQKLTGMGVDGLITDYPDRYFNSVSPK
jgi:glycerophosphoryl diester phosphodiesterase